MIILEDKQKVSLLNDLAKILETLKNESNPIEAEALIARLSPFLKKLNAEEPNTEHASENSTETDPQVNTSCCFGFSKWR